jgi:hypothetical protein
MRRALIGLAAVVWLAMTATVPAATGRVVKVLPEFLDLKGLNSLSPSLYERDGYQAVLRQHPEKRSGVRFYIQWKTKGGVWEALKLRLELRGIAQGGLPRRLVVDEPVETTGRRLSHWTKITLDGERYKEFGEVTGWRVTLWEGEQVIGQQQSFLW